MASLDVLARFAALFEEIGLEPPDAARSAERAFRTMLGTWPTVSPAPTQGVLGSVSRLLGLRGVPFLDPERKLELVAFARVLSESGLRMDVALAFAKVMVEAYSAEDLYEPVWAALGQGGPIDWSKLPKLDVSGLEPAPRQDSATTVTVKAEPRSATTPTPRPPTASRPAAPRPASAKSPAPAKSRR
ncbi:MAG: hypothetical protein HY791_07570 [Deltaproteobacteria bacterium]|nr:hypothetical protein [Deltaproteobacteria bacterium]